MATFFDRSGGPRWGRCGHPALFAAVALCLLAHPARAFEVVDIATRPGVTQRFLYRAPEKAKAAVILFAGGHGGLQIADDGRLGWGSGNFLVRSRDLFVEQGLAVAVIDAPSDRQQATFLSGARQRPEHASDVQALIAWLRQKAQVPVWLVGTSRGTQSAAYVATQLGGAQGPDGIVLTSTILTDRRGRPVPEMPLDALTIPVLVVHHAQDACRFTLYADMPRLMRKLASNPRKDLLTVSGGTDQGDPCEARAYHGFNGLEREVVEKISAWIAR